MRAHRPRCGAPAERRPPHSRASSTARPEQAAPDCDRWPADRTSTEDGRSSGPFDELVILPEPPGRKPVEQLACGLNEGNAPGPTARAHPIPVEDGSDDDTAIADIDLFQVVHKPGKASGSEQI